MRNILEDKTEDEIQMLMKKRESHALAGVVSHVVNGAMLLDESEEDIYSKVLMHELEHKKCLYHLLSLGADINARDYCGMTALHLIADGGAGDNKAIVELAEILIKAGAEVDGMNRFGLTPLFAAAKSQAYALELSDFK